MSSTTADPSAHLVPAPRDRSSPQLTLRAIGTGVVLGAVLSLCNIYSGLKIGWSNNMSITAGLLAYAGWRALRITGAKPLGLLENNINQTTASSAASISSAGLVAAVPALTMLTGLQLSWPLLALWTFSVCLVGISVAIGLRRQMIVVDRLPFPNGIATAETLKEMYARGSEAVVRVWALIAAAVAAGALKLAENFARLPRVGLPFSFEARGALAERGASSLTMANVTYAVDPSLLMIGVGALIGIRAGLSLLLGAIVAWLILAPEALARGWADPGRLEPAAIWFTSVNKWLLWPGVSLMVTASLTSFAFSYKSIARAIMRRGGSGGEDEGEVKRSWFLSGLVVAAILSVTLQVWLFGIGAVVALIGVLMTFGIAVVAGRVSGETNVTPVGPMGKITQLIFGVLAPGQPAPNLMAANVTGGAASQCGDLLHDLKCGWLVGATPRYQAVAQVFGALSGALAGSAAYLLLIPDPATQLLTPEWPAPAVATWKAVAEIFVEGMKAMPPGALAAMLIAGAVGVVLAILEKTVPSRLRAYVPSGTALGLAFVLPAYNAIYMFLGAGLALSLGRAVPRWSERFVVVIAAGLIAGESLTGVGIALQKMLFP
jgi:putative OPT family oligopeptide transporter